MNQDIFSFEDTLKEIADIVKKLNIAPEIWGIVKEDPKYPNPIFQGLYMASTHGNIRRFHKGEWEDCKQTLTDRGYCVVSIKHKKCQRKVHRMVALTFLDNPINKSSVNHKIPIKTLNTLENLEWSTMKENTVHSVENDCRPLKPRRKFKYKRKNFDTLEEYYKAYLDFHHSVVEAMENEITHAKIREITGLCERTVRCIARRREHVMAMENLIPIKPQMELF
jgi:signal recognition particle subunit SEC65